MRKVIDCQTWLHGIPLEGTQEASGSSVSEPSAILGELVMMKQFLKFLLGLNVIAFTHLLRGEPRQFLAACRRAFTTARRKEIVSPDLDLIPQTRLEDILGDRKPAITLSVMRYEDGMLPADQAMALLAILVAEGPEEVLEVGTYMGHTSKLMALNLEHSMIHTVDLPVDFSAEDDPGSEPPKDDCHLIRKRAVGREFMGHACSTRIRQHFGDTARWNFQFAGNPTFFFIDGAHTYEYCKNDSEKCLALCKGRGVFLWHDCDERHPGVVKLILEWRAAGRNVVRVHGTPLAYWKAA